MKNYFTITLAVLGPILLAQFSTPNTGKTYTISELDALTEAISYNSETNTYTLNEDLTIAETDAFLVDSDFILAIAAKKIITVEGKLNIHAPKKVVFTSQNPGTSYFGGIRLAESSTTSIRNFTMLYGGGIRVLSKQFSMEDSEISYQEGGVSTSSAVSFFRGNPLVKNSKFVYNRTPVVSSGANETVGLTFEGNYLENNNIDNTNRPQINMGPSGPNQQIIIKDNQIIGGRTNTKVGGIAISTFFGSTSDALIENNVIRDNRYGLTLTGAGSKGIIRDNIISNNNSENLPDVGGSGISISIASLVPGNVIYILNNTLENNLWGITNIGNGASINLGDNVQAGNNVFSHNENRGVTYALYNNSPLDISAHGNCWIKDAQSTTKDVEGVIFHKKDKATLGEVDFSNHLCSTLGVNDLKDQKINFYPNPNKGQFTIDVEEVVAVEIYTMNGQLVFKTKTRVGKNIVTTGLTKGVYLLKVNQKTSKLLIN